VRSLIERGIVSIIVPVDRFQFIHIKYIAPTPIGNFVVNAFHVLVQLHRLDGLVFRACGCAYAAHWSVIFLRWSMVLLRTEFDFLDLDF
jgi:hypothetical protein